MAIDAAPPPSLPPTPPAAAVSAALTTTNVRVTSSFRGARIVLYGAVLDPSQKPSDVVVIVRGPDAPVRIEATEARPGEIFLGFGPGVGDPR